MVKLIKLKDLKTIKKLRVKMSSKIKKMTQKLKNYKKKMKNLKIKFRK